MNDVIHKYVSFVSSHVFFLSSFTQSRVLARCGKFITEAEEKGDPTVRSVRCLFFSLSRRHLRAPHTPVTFTHNDTQLLKWKTPSPNCIMEPPSRADDDYRECSHCGHGSPCAHPVFPTCASLSGGSGAGSIGSCLRVMNEVLWLRVRTTRLAHFT